MACIGWECMDCIKFTNSGAILGSLHALWCTFTHPLFSEMVDTSFNENNIPLQVIDRFQQSTQVLVWKQNSDF